MNSFLYAVASHVLGDFGPGLDQMAFVLPNRRAGQVFKNCLAKIAGKPIWTPKIVSVDDWLTEVSSFTEASKITCLLALFEAVQKKTGQKESIDHFIRWGEMLIRDFDEIDKYLVEPENIFQTLFDLKMIETQFPSLDEEQIRLLHNFWQGFHPTPSTYQEKWLRLWKSLEEVYYDFHIGLNRLGLATSGYIYRDACKKILDNPGSVLEHQKYVFIGFNALTRAEERIFDYCKSSGKGLFYWDLPEILRAGHEESGKFIRQNIRKYPPPDNFSNEIMGLPDRFARTFPPHFEQVRIYACESASGQVSLLRQVLSDNTNQNSSSEKWKKAVVLADEALLEPVLSAISNSETEINISMGYPIEHSLLVDFIIRVLSLNQNIPAERTEEAFMPAGQLMQLFQHPVMPFLIKDNLDDARNRLEKWPASMIPLRLVLGKGGTLQDILCVKNTNSLIDSLLNLLNNFVAVNEKIEALERESYRLVRDWIRELRQEHESRKLEISLECFSSMFRDFTRKQRLSFEGSLEAEIQLTGILETRLMDYDEVIILSCNEGIWPADSTPPTLIPYNLRKASNMPTREFSDSFYGYYFYRLLQRSKKVRLLYVNSPDPGKMSQGEPSRFIQQMKYGPGHSISEYLSVSAINPGMPAERVIFKNGAIYEAIKQYLIKDSGNYLSPSALNSYLDCPFRFALSYLLNIREGEDLVEASDPRMFGKLMHKTLELLYLGFADSGKVVEKDFLNALLKNDRELSKYIKDAFLSEYFKMEPGSKWTGLFGKDLLVYEVLLKQLKSVLLVDREYAPFRIIGLEKKVNYQIDFSVDGKELSIVLGGFVDRMDEKEGLVRILDYKSGSPEMKFKSFEDLAGSRSSGRPKEILQALIYSFLYHHSQNENRTIQPVIYPTGKMSRSSFDPGLQYQKETVKDISLYIDNIQELLQHVLSEMFNPGIDFKQTDNEDTCKYCSFADYCQR